MSTEARELLEKFGSGLLQNTVNDTAFRSHVLDKWGPLLEGMATGSRPAIHKRDAMAMLFEMQMRYLAGKADSLDEEVRSINTGAFTKFVFPVLRRVFPSLISSEIFSVQPMTAPVGAIFYYDNIYGTSKGSTQAGNVFPRDFDKDYTSELINGEILITGNGADFGGGGAAFSAVFAFSPVRPKDTSRGLSVTISEINPVPGAVIQTAVDDGAGGFVFTPSGGSTAGSLNYANGALSAFKFQNIVANNNQVKVFYSYDGELNQKIPQSQFDIRKATVEVENHRLKSIWSSESAEDFRALQGMDAETEIVSNAAQEIALEIDRRLLDRVFLASTTTTGTFDRVPPAGIAELDHLRGMITVIATVSNLIHKRTLRAPANWIVTSPEVSALFAQFTTHGDYRALYTSGGESPYGPADMPRPLTQHGQFGIYRMGTLQNKWMVYEDPYFTRDMMLIGLKGSSYLDSGAVWAPYVPLQVTPTFLDPADGSYRKGLRTRYAFKITRPEFFGQLRVLNI